MKRFWLGLPLLLGGSLGMHLALEPGYPVAPPPLWAVGALLLGLVLALPALIAGAPEASTPSPPAFRWSWPLWRMGLLLLTALLSVLLLFYLPRAQQWNVAALVWVGSMGLYLAAVSRETAPLPRPTRRQALGLLLITIAGALLRVVALDRVPPVLGGDEASQGLEAARVLTGEVANPFATGWLGVPTLSFFYNALGLGVWGQSMVGLRIPWALLGGVTVPLVYWLGTELRNGRWGLAAAFLTATYHFHLHFSRLGSNQIADPLFATLALIALQRGRREHSRLAWSMAGVLAGLALYFYAGARFTPVLLLGVWGLDFVRDSGRRRRLLSGGLLMAGGFLVSAAPMLQYGARFPADFNARLNQVGIFQSGWLAAEMTTTGRSAMALLAEQLGRALLAFNYYPDRTVWYGLEAPLLGPLAGALLLLGVAAATGRAWREPWVRPLVIWWWGGLLLGGMLTDNPPSSQRLVTLTVPASFLLLVGGRSVWRAATRRRRRMATHPTTRLAVAVLLLLFAAGSVGGYFLEFTPRRLYGGPQAEIATLAASQLAELDPAYVVYFFGAPRMTWGFATFEYLAPRRHGVNVGPTWTAPPHPAVIPPESGAIFLVLPERAAELRLIQEAFPWGEYRPVVSPTRGTVAALYIVPAQE